MGLKRSGGSVSGFGSAPSFGVSYAYNSLGGTASGGAQPWKGSGVIPYEDTLIYAIYFLAATTNTYTYQGAVVTVSGTTIATISKTEEVVATATGDTSLFLKFATPVALTGGATYYIMLGRNDGTDTWALPVKLEAVPALSFPFSYSPTNTYIRTENAVPAVSDTVSFLTTHIVNTGVLWAFV